MLGVIKFYLQRLVTYVSLVQFGMVVYLFFKQSGISPWWLVLCLPTGIFIVWFDRKYVLQGELAEFFRQNPEWVKRNEDRPQCRNCFTCVWSEKGGDAGYRTCRCPFAPARNQYVHKDQSCRWHNITKEMHEQLLQETR